MPSVQVKSLVGLGLIEVGVVELEMFLLDVVVGVEEAGTGGITIGQGPGDGLVDKEGGLVILSREGSTLE